MGHMMRKTIGVIAIAGATASGLLASGAFASANPKVPIATLGTWTLHFAYYTSGRPYTTGTLSITFGPTHVYRFTTGVTGTYTYSKLNGKVTFKITRACYPAFTLYGGATSGFTGTIHCTLPTTPHENGYAALGNPPGLTSQAGARSGALSGLT